MEISKIIAVAFFLILYGINAYLSIKKNPRSEVEWVSLAVAPAFIAWVFHSVLS